MPDDIHPLAPALAVLEGALAGRPVAQFARAHDLHIWFGYGPFDTGGWAGNPWGAWLVLPKAFQDPAVMGDLANALLIGHELVHVMQNAARGFRVPFPLLREVEAHTVQQVLTWETASAAPDPEATRRDAVGRLALLTAGLEAGFQYVLAQGEGLRPLNFYRTPLFTRRGAGDPLANLADLLAWPAFPAYVADILASG